jgi:hypothetical protein
MKRRAIIAGIVALALAPLFASAGLFGPHGSGGIGGVSKTIYLTTTGSLQSWTVPSDWTSANNTIELIAGGGGGRNGGAGGGGGSYSKITNLSLTPGAGVSYRVGAGGVGGPSGTTGVDGTSGGDTWFNGTTGATASVWAIGGQGGTGAGGAGGTGGTGTIKNNGGNGGGAAGSGISGSPGGGGAGGRGGAGGAGGNYGGNGGGGGGANGGGSSGAVAGASAGANGGASISISNQVGQPGGIGATSAASAGGVGSQGSGGGGGFGNASSASAGGNGGNGTEWDATHGSGGGGGGGGDIHPGTSPNGGNGGLYGGGGSGAGNGDVRGKGGDGRQGIIVITYGGTVVPVQTISSVTVNNTGFTEGSPDGTLVGSISTVMSPPTPLFSGTYSLAGANAGAFRIPTTPGNQLVLNGTQPSLTLVFNPASPSVDSAVAANTIVSTTTVTRSDGRSFNGTVGFAAPNNDDSGRFALSAVSSPTSGNMNIKTVGSLSGVGGTTRNITVQATDTTTPSTFTIKLVATPSDPTIAPFTTSDITITGSAAPPSQTIVSTTLDSSQFTAGAGSANALVGHLSVTMDPISPAFAGTLTQTNGSFTITNCMNSVCELRVGVADLSPGTFNINGTATPTDTSIAPKPFSFVVTGNGPAGSTITTFTFANNTGASLPIGTPVRFGQAFRRGDVPQGDCVRPRNASTHANLSYNLSEIATRRENSDDNSIRHLVWWIRTDVAIPSPGTYTLEWVKTGAACPAQTPRTAAAMKARLVAAGHALKLTFTDVRNQDGSLRGVSGHNTLTFDVNSALDNTGRDAPRSCGAGAVNDCWILSGPPKNDQGVADPMLYVQFYLDATSNADGTLGKLVHSALVHNDWMNVAAGTAGNSAAPGPVGLANDPQAISYRPQLLDGATNQLNWSWWDQSVTSASNPVRTGGSAGGCDAGMPYHGNGNWTFPASTGLNAITNGMAFWYHTAGTPPTGMTNNSLIFAFGSGIESGRINGLPDTTDVHFTKAQFHCHAGVGSYDPTDQGSGTQLFDWRVWHFHPGAWITVDQNAADNVTAADGTRTAYSIYPALQPTEQMYWKQTGTVVPTRNTSGMADTIDYGGDIALNVYSPMGLGNAHVGNAGANHNNLAQVNEFMSQAFLGETKALWDVATIQSAGVYGASWASLLNERTGRIPALNNGPPGPGIHGGGGGSYPGLGAPFGNVGPYGVNNTGARTFSSAIYGMVPALDNVPFDDANNGYYRGGVKGWGLLDNSHWGSFHNGIYQILGQRRVLDTIYQTANRAIIVTSPEDGIGHVTDTKNGVRYYALITYCCEGRGAQNAYREFTLGAALGGDTNEERAYFTDVMNENYWHQQATDAYLDGSTTTFRSLYTDPWQHWNGSDPYMDSYGGQMAYQGYAMLRDPLSHYFLDHYNAIYSSACSDAPGNLSSFYCVNFQYISNLRDGGGLITLGNFGANIGQYFVNDVSERGIIASYWNFAIDGTGLVCKHIDSADYNLLQDGDKVKNHPVGGSPAPDQLVTSTWYTVTQVDNSAVDSLGHPTGETKCMKILNPATGTPFTTWTLNGSPWPSPTLDGYIKVRPSRTRAGWAGSYGKYIQDVFFGLKALGFSGINAAITVMSQRSIADGFPSGVIDPGSSETRNNWEPNLVVP